MLGGQRCLRRKSGQFCFDICQGIFLPKIRNKFADQVCRTFFFFTKQNFSKVFAKKLYFLWSAKFRANVLEAFSEKQDNHVFPLSDFNDKTRKMILTKVIK